MAAQIRPLKQFGQNFLHNRYYAENIVEALEPKEDDLIIEIGAGKGALTSVLSEYPFNELIALEIDDRLINFLRNTFDKRVKIFQQSFLEFPVNDFSKGRQTKIIGNIPYHLTTEILFKIIENHQTVCRAVLMVQKEVANRLLAKERTKDYGVLTILMNCYADIKHVLDVDRRNFYPVPGVDSSVIRLDLQGDITDLIDEMLFKRLVRKSFQQRRKMLRNSLKTIFSTSIVDQIASVSLQARPEELTIKDFKNLSNEITRLTKN